MRKFYEKSCNGDDGYNNDNDNKDRDYDGDNNNSSNTIMAITIIEK